jgi:hypothetical protein
LFWAVLEGFTIPSFFIREVSVDALMSSISAAYPELAGDET